MSDFYVSQTTRLYVSKKASRIHLITNTLQETNIFDRGKGKIIIFKSAGNWDRGIC